MHLAEFSLILSDMFFLLGMHLSSLKDFLGTVGTNCLGFRGQDLTFVPPFVVNVVPQTRTDLGFYCEMSAMLTTIKANAIKCL